MRIGSYYIFKYRGKNRCASVLDVRNLDAKPLKKDTLRRRRIERGDTLVTLQGIDGQIFSIYPDLVASPIRKLNWFERLCVNATRRILKSV